MLRLFLISISTCIINASLHANASGAENYNYYGFSGASSSLSLITLDTNDNLLIYPGTYINYNDCSTKERFCFESPRLAFCSPTKQDLLRGNWECGERKNQYYATESVEIKILGKSIPAYIVSTTGVNFYFNQQLGVVMFKIIGNQVAEIYWSADGVGFGASPTK